MDMSLSKLQEMMKDRKPGVLQSMVTQRVRHNWATKQQFQVTTWMNVWNLTLKETKLATKENELSDSIAIKFKNMQN